MDRSSFAFFVSLLLHIVILLLLWILWNFIPDTKPQTLHKEKKIKISLKEMPKKEQKSGLTKQKTEPIPIVPPMPKGSQLKKIVKQKTVKYKPKKIPKKTKLNKPSPVKKIIKKTVTKQKIKPLPTKKSYIPLEKKSKNQRKNKINSPGSMKTNLTKK